MINYVLYEPNTGKIVQIGTAPESQIAIQGTKDHQVLEGDGTLTDHYVHNNVITKRPSMDLSINGNTISNIPVPSSVFINGMYYPCNDTQVDFDFTYPGEYHIRIESFPYLDYETKLVQK